MKLRLGLLEEFIIKKVEAEQRLSNAFAAFVVTKDGLCFVAASKVSPVRVQQNENFGGIIIGETNKDTEEMTSVFRAVCMSIQSAYSEDDVHARLVVDMMSNYLRWTIEDMDSPQATASEMLIYDMHRQVIHQIFLNGDFTEIPLGETKEKQFFVGAYSKRLRRMIAKELQKMPEVSKALKDPKLIGPVVSKLGKLTGMKFVNVIAVKRSGI